MLAGIAGCANAGGFLALGHYTSHMTGYLSQLADNVVLWNVAVVIDSAFAIALFVCGAACSAILINWARDHRRRSQYALPIAAQGVLFLCFAGFGALGRSDPMVNRLALGVLCFIMGLQNATITKISYARIRTTHVTGMITDIGIEFGKSLYARGSRTTRVSPDLGKMQILLQLLCVFVVGGIIGAVGYSRFGFVFSVPLALLLLAIAAPKLRR